MKAIQVFHTVRIVLYNGRSGPVVECLNKINMVQSTTRPMGQNTRLQNYAYSMKSLNSFQNAQASDFELFHIKVLSFCILATVSIDSRTYAKIPFILFFRKKNNTFLTLLWHCSDNQSAHKNVNQIHSWIYE